MIACPYLQNEHPNLGRTPPKKRKRVSVDATEPKAVWTEHDNEKSNALLAQMLCECAVPFNTVSHPAFLEWVGHLNPSYGPANRTALSDIYLEQLYIKTKTEVDKRLKDTSVVFCVDQSKDGAGDPKKKTNAPLVLSAGFTPGKEHCLVEKNLVSLYLFILTNRLSVIKSECN